MEFITVSTLNEILLPPFIFLVTFCFLCCQVASPIPKSGTNRVTELKPLNQNTSICEPHTETVVEIKEEEENLAIAENPYVEAKEETLEIEASPIGGATSLEESSSDSCLNQQDSSEQLEIHGLISKALDTLTKRQARKLMGGLGLQQKRNGVELSTELMIANIKREFKTNPEKLIQIIEERLPEIISVEIQSEPVKVAS